MNLDTDSINAADHVEAFETSGTSPPVRAVGEHNPPDPNVDYFAEWAAEQAAAGPPPQRSAVPLPVEFGLHLASLPRDERKAAREAARVAEVSALPLNELPDGSRFRYEPVGPIMEGGIPPPDQLIPGLLYERRVHWLAGHPKQGKTTVAMFAARQVMASGRHVVWLDWEAGTRPTLARLADVGVSAADAAERFHLVSAPPLEAGPEGFAPIADALDHWPGALVVFDSASKALSVAGLDENAPTDATNWTMTIVMPVREAGGTAIVIDHVTKGATRSTPYARGAGSKKADTDAIFYVEQTRTLSREQVGEIRLTNLGDRDGLLAETLRYEVGDGRGGLPFTLLEAETAESGERKSDAVRARVAGLLRKHDGEALSGRQVEQMVSGRRADIADALRELADDPSEPYTAEAGPRRSVLYRFDASAAAALPVA